MATADIYKIQPEDENIAYKLEKTSPHIAPLGTQTKFGQKPTYASDKISNIGTEFRSLLNLGNTCYMNVILQCLLHTPLFNNYLVSEIYKEDLNLELGRSLLIEPFSKLAIAYTKNSDVDYELRDLRASVIRTLPSFGPSMQYDAQELFSAILDRLKMELTKSHKENLPSGQTNMSKNSDIMTNNDKSLKEYKYKIPDEHKKKSNSMILNNENMNIGIRLLNKEEKKDGSSISPIDTLFAGKLNAITRCSACDNEVKKIDAFYHLSLPIPEVY